MKRQTFNFVANKMKEQCISRVMLTASSIKPEKKGCRITQFFDEALNVPSRKQNDSRHSKYPRKKFQKDRQR